VLRLKKIACNYIIPIHVTSPDNRKMLYHDEWRLFRKVSIYLFIL
jgi:hypothetical protein